MGRAALLPRDKEKVSGMSSRSLLDSVFQLSIQGTYLLHELARLYELLEYQAESDRTNVAMLEEQLKEARSENASLKKEVIKAETRASGLQEDLAKAKRENVEIEEQGKNAACDLYSEIPYKVKRKYVRRTSRSHARLRRSV